MITGTMFVHNAISNDYCVIEALSSLLPFCDKVIIMDCSSTDGTTELIRDFEANNPKVKGIYNRQWSVGLGYERLRLHANFVKSFVDTKYHFMLQADEVVHESSIPAIIKAIEKGSPAYMVRRYNLWAGQDLYIKFDSVKKCVGDMICRLALKEYEAERDAESLSILDADYNYLEDIKIIHYGFVRTGYKMIDKIINMQRWFLETEPGKNDGGQDPEVIRQKDSGIFDSTVFFKPEHLDQLPFKHPKYMHKWLSERNNDATFRGYI